VDRAAVLEDRALQARAAHRGNEALALREERARVLADELERRRRDVDDARDAADVARAKGRRRSASEEDDAQDLLVQDEAVLELLARAVRRMRLVRVEEEEIRPISARVQPFDRAVDVALQTARVPHDGVLAGHVVVERRIEIEALVEPEVAFRVAAFGEGGRA